MKWITATRLESWARARSSAVDLPGMISDLVRASSSDITAIRFPSGEKGQVRGFDGHLVSSVRALNVPEGRSYWEFGTDDDYKLKAKGDFEKRSKELDENHRIETTYVFVTPWTWDSSKKDGRLEEWIECRKREFKWKDIVGIDGVALETWLECRPAVSAWHARNTIKCAPLEGVRSTDDYWDEFADRFRPKITEDVLLCEREAATEQLINALMGRPACVSFSADSPDEVIAFAIAAIRRAKPEVRLFLEARTLIVDTMAAGRQLLGEENLIFFLRDDAARSPGQFGERGPTVVPLGRQQRNGVTQALVRPSGYSMGVAMKTMGFGENEAITMARGCGRSLTALARRIPSGSCEPPSWQNSLSLLPAILAGSWDSDHVLDRDVLRKLAGVEDYFQYESQLRSFLRNADPPLDLEGTAWKVRAPMDAFIHVGHLIGQEHLDVLRSVMTDVFAKIEADPRPDEVVQISMQREQEYSSWLREGLATNLLLIAIWGKEAELNLRQDAGQRFADDLITALPGLRTNHRLLASLRDELPLLAEAAPNPLLSALESMLEGKAEAIRPIFDEVDGILYPRSRHTGLLWALETLAWDPDYFRRAVLVLARLAAIDPGGRLVNRPSNSLREIFIPWDPNTNASAALRLAVLDEIVKSVPQVSWNLLCSLLPTPHAAWSLTARPKLREVGASKRGPTTYGEVWRDQEEIVRRAIRCAGTDPLRWGYLVPTFANYAAKERSAAITGLEATLAALPDAERKGLWSQIRDEVAKHERFATAKWALPAAELAPLQLLVKKYAPEDPVSEVAWLFDTWTLDATGSLAKAAHQRAQAMRELFASAGIEGVLRLGLETKLPYLAVEAVAAAEIGESDTEFALMESLRRDRGSDFTVGLAGLYRRLVGVQRAQDWLIEALSSGTVDSELAARFLLAWPDDTTTWYVARRLGRDISTAYWKKKNPSWPDGPRRVLFRSLLMFLRVGRAVATLQAAYNRLGELPSRFIMKILDEAVTELNRRSTPLDSMVSHYVERAFAELDNRKDVAELDLGMREFAFLSLLESSNRPLRLHSLMASSPVLYHQVLREVFRGENERQLETDSSTQARWRLSYALLSKFTQLPGRGDDGIDATALSEWVDQVRALGAKTDRSQITDAYVGHLLAHAPIDEDGGWPHRVIRDQIERIGSTELERGIQIERFNMRGVHSRARFEGGDPEREFAASNYRYAKIADGWPRTAALLRSIAKNWEADAEREDVRAAQDRLRS